MIRYQAAAVAFKAFSMNGATRKLYRSLGNFVRERVPSGLPSGQNDYTEWHLSRLRETGLLDGRPVHGLEIGTGWVHLLGLASSIAGVATMDLYDVWDNRQLNRLRLAFSDFDQRLSRFGIEPSAEVKRKIHAIRTAARFEEIYAALGARYFVDPGGTLSALDGDSYDFACSTDVIEHVRRESLKPFVEGIFRILKPGAFSIHQIGLGDHLTHYDRKASMKQFLSYGETEWNIRFENSIQYFNRVPFDAICELFDKAGFETVVIDAEELPDAVKRLARISPQFQGQTPRSLNAVRGFIAHRKPG